MRVKALAAHTQRTCTSPSDDRLMLNQHSLALNYGPHKCMQYCQHRAGTCASQGHLPEEESHNQKHMQFSPPTHPLSVVLSGPVPGSPAVLLPALLQPRGENMLQAEQGMVGEVEG